MTEKLNTKECYSCGVALGEDVQLCGFVPREMDPDKIMDFSNAQPACAICYNISAIENQLRMLRFFVKDRTRLVKLKKQEKE